jgi:hypothetical protein
MKILLIIFTILFAFNKSQALVLQTNIGARTHNATSINTTIADKPKSKNPLSFEETAIFSFATILLGMLFTIIASNAFRNSNKLGAGLGEAIVALLFYAIGIILGIISAVTFAINPSLKGKGFLIPTALILLSLIFLI